MNEERSNFTVRIVCLANSRKTSGRCIAGKELDVTGQAGRWLRPVSPRPTHEISELDMLCPDGETAKLLDILEIPCVKPVPQGHQPENVLIDARFFWQRHNRINWQALNQMLDKPAPLWTNGFSTRQGHNNRIPESLLDSRQGSLRLIALDRVLLHAGPKAPKFGDMKQVVRASFDYQGDHYCLDVTDPVIESYFLKTGAIEHALDTTLACISLTETWEGYVYKLVASIITSKRAAFHD
jgi:hypothetical protein